MRNLLVPAALVALLVAPALAVDEWGGPPGPDEGGWIRGEPGSTYQKFDMSTPIQGDNPPIGMGEPPIARATPAMNNAIFADTGVRIREQPWRKAGIVV